MDQREDGRTARRGRNSDAVLDTVHEMFVEGNFSPSVEEVAARSGVSLRSVYRYFEDTEALLHMAIERRIALVGELYVLDGIGEGSLPDRILSLVDQRLVLHS
jgi:AcrR family transcriptional regulator